MYRFLACMIYFTTFHTAADRTHEISQTRANYAKLLFFYISTDLLPFNTIIGCVCVSIARWFSKSDNATQQRWWKIGRQTPLIFGGGVMWSTILHTHRLNGKFFSDVYIFFCGWIIFGHISECRLLHNLAHIIQKDVQILLINYLQLFNLRTIPKSLFIIK